MPAWSQRAPHVVREGCFHRCFAQFGTLGVTRKMRCADVKNLGDSGKCDVGANRPASLQLFPGVLACPKGLEEAA
jgi:hypothetical protein